MPITSPDQRRWQSPECEGDGAGEWPPNASGQPAPIRGFRHLTYAASIVSIANYIQLSTAKREVTDGICNATHAQQYWPDRDIGERRGSRPPFLSGETRDKIFVCGREPGLLRLWGHSAHAR